MRLLILYIYTYTYIYIYIYIYICIYVCVYISNEVVLNVFVDAMDDYYQVNKFIIITSPNIVLCDKGQVTNDMSLWTLMSIWTCHSQH